MKFIRKCPFFIILLSTGLLFTIIAAGGMRTVYAQQEYLPLKAPLLSVMFAAINDDIYPWQVLDQESLPVSEPAAEPDVQEAAGDPEMQATEQDPVHPEDVPPARVPSPEQSPSGEQTPAADEGEEETMAESDDQDEEQQEKQPDAGMEGEELPETERTEIPEGRLKPLRESTHEEYLNHISADIYGDAGVLRAAEYEFVSVDESYFDDALFIGDSRTVGLRDYTDLSEHADFYCETSLTIYKVLEEDFKGLGTISEALAARDYGKIYIMVGINELGRGTTENYMEKYTEVIDTLHELEPEAKIFIQGVMRVSGKKNSEDAIFNNSNIIARNNAVATLADNENIFYIDVNEVVCDEEGNLNADYTFDQIHLLGVYNDLWKQFLLGHGVNV